MVNRLPPDVGFARALATRDPLGVSRGVHAPRFDRRQAIAAPPSDPVSLRTLTAPVNFNLCLGADESLLVYIARDNNGADEEMVIWRVPPGQEEGASGDDLKVIAAQANGNFEPVNDHNGGGDSQLAYQPRSGICWRNCILIGGPVSEGGLSSSYPNARWFVAISNDSGDTWQLIRDETIPGVDDQRGFLGGASTGGVVSGPWFMSREQNPALGYIVASDYESKLGTTQGGEMHAVAIRRQGDGSYAIDDHSVRFVDRTGVNGEHMHSGGVLKWLDGGVEKHLFFAAQGDGHDSNAVLVRAVEPQYFDVDAQQQRIGSAGDPGSQWGALKVAHGGGVNDAVGSALNRQGNQFVGCAPGPSEREAILGVDDQNGPHLTLIDSADYDDAEPGFSRMTPIWPGARTESNCFAVHCAQPNLGRGYAAARSDTPSTSDGEHTLLSDDGLCWALCGQGTLLCRRGSYLYLRAAGSPPVMQRLAINPIVVARPLCLSSAPPAQEYDPNAGSGPTINSTWDGSVTKRTAEEVADSRYPGPDDEVWRYVQAGQTSPDPPALALHYGVAAGADLAKTQRMRVWLRNNNNYGLKARVVGDWFAPLEGLTLLLNSRGAWEPFDLQITPDGAGSGTLFAGFRSDTGESDADYHVDVDFAVEGVAAGADGSTYARVWDYQVAAGTTITAAMDETISIGLPGGLKSALLAFSVPERRWDRRTPSMPGQSAGGDGLELCRFVGDASNYLRVGVILADGQTPEIVLSGQNAATPFRVAISQKAGETWKILGGAPLLVGVSHDGVNLVGAGTAGQWEGDDASLALGAFAVPLTTLQQPEGDVWPLRWWGFGRRGPMNADALRGELRSLGFVRRIRSRGQNLAAPPGLQVI